MKPYYNPQLHSVWQYAATETGEANSGYRHYKLCRLWTSQHTLALFAKIDNESGYVRLSPVVSPHDNSVIARCALCEEGNIPVMISDWVSDYLVHYTDGKIIACDLGILAGIDPEGCIFGQAMEDIQFYRVSARVSNME